MTTGAINIGRSGPFGNPFKIGRDGTRAEVVLAHEAWLWFPEQLPLRNRIRRELAGRKRWCPGCRGTHPCHNDNFDLVLSTPMEETP